MLLILNEVDGDRKLPIVIGAFEAQSIAIALEKEIKPPRPLTHDLFKNFADRFDIVVKQVIIHKLVDGVFYSSIICRTAIKLKKLLMPEQAMPLPWHCDLKHQFLPIKIF